jgi:hypothetical protein
MYFSKRNILQAVYKLLFRLLMHNFTFIMQRKGSELLNYGATSCMLNAQLMILCNTQPAEPHTSCVTQLKYKGFGEFFKHVCNKFRLWSFGLLGETSDSHGNEYKGDCLQGRCNIECDRN